jgi:nucleoside-diphosphate-sugar epimerase
LPALQEAATTGDHLDLTEGKQKRDFTYVEDVVEGLLRLGVIKTTPGEIINLATGQLTTVRGFVETAAQIMQISADKLRFGAIPTRVEEMEHAPVSVNRLRQIADWLPPTDIKNGISKTVEFAHNLDD